jgi:hypothetical protein
LSLSSVILSSSFTRCKYCSSYRSITTKSIKVVFSKGKLKTANPRPLSAKSTIRPKIEGGGGGGGGGYRFLTREFMKVEVIRKKVWSSASFSCFSLVLVKI